jgi:hypothetical protein
METVTNKVIDKAFNEEIGEAQAREWYAAKLRDGYIPDSEDSEDGGPTVLGVGLPSDDCIYWTH